MTPTVTSNGDAFAGARESMVRDQIETRGIQDPLVLAAMRTVPRHRFVPEEYLRQLIEAVGFLCLDIRYPHQVIPFCLGEGAHLCQFCCAPPGGLHKHGGGLDAPVGQ